MEGGALSDMNLKRLFGLRSANLENDSFAEKTVSLSSSDSIRRPDWILLVATVALMVIGVMFIYSARMVSESHLSWYQTNAFRQCIWYLIGTGLAVGICVFDYKTLCRFSFIAYWGAIFILILVLIPHVGTYRFGARRWIDLGILQFQPSELAKPAVVLAFASLFSGSINIFEDRKIPFYILFGAMLFLILKQPNLSMVILLCMTSVVMYFAAGGRIKTILAAFAAAVPVFAFSILGYQKQRILVWLDPQKDPHNAGYNIIQSLVAFAGGGFFGVGFGNSKQKLSWLPEGHTDFIFAVIAEEFGFLGCFFIICLFAMFAYRGFIVAKRCPDMFGKLLAVGITFSICFQALMNISVASSFLPATGIPLPFISYGGSSLFVSLCMFGVLLNISKKRVQRIKPYAPY